MCPWRDLEERLQNGIGGASALHVSSVYRNTPLPGWLLRPLEECIQASGTKTPVLVINVKGRRTGDVLCLLTLAGLERLVTDLPAGEGPGSADADTPQE